MARGEPAYVVAAQVNLRDRLSAVYNKAGVVKNGEQVEILEKSKRFVRVRSPRGEEGWMEARQLVGPEVAASFAKLEKDNQNAPVQARGAARAELNMHDAPGREAQHLYRLDEGAKVEILRRATAEKPQAKIAPSKQTPVKPGREKESQPASPVREDWWLVRDAQRHTGWVLARMIDLDVPIEIAQYAEGQRIMAFFVLNHVTDIAEDGQSRQVPQYLTVLNSPRDGTPWDFDQLRVFTWNPKRHRYETAYRERNLYGVFPVTVGHEVFEKEGDLPVFTIRIKDENGNVSERKYKLNQPIVRRVLSPEEQKAEDARRAARLQEALQRRAARRAARKR
jgi:SH3-like domain-containing protein